MTATDLAASARLPVRRTGPAVWVGALTSVAIVSGVVGFAIGREGPAPFEAKVVAISSDGDSLCVDRKEDTCGLLLVRPVDRERIKPGRILKIREMWVEYGDGEHLVFSVEPPG